MIKVCGHRLLIKQIDYLSDNSAYQELKKMGLEIAETDDNRRAKESMDQGTVLQIGPSAWKDFGTEHWCKVGDFITYAKFAGKLLIDPDTGDKYYAINDEDVVAVLKEAQ
jgi:co-chaperonin GroES (HSP10)